MDLILGRYADTYIGELSDRDLTDFEALMDVADQDLFDWITGARPVAPQYASQLFHAIVAFHFRRHDQS